ncbi:MAG TPA: hypothetical protein VFQ15_02880, partial [Jiangellaceae bacterium]|nr:hypothetical protein [Jiangellaceae bacterium]
VYFVIGATFSLCGLTLASSLDTHALGIASIMVPFLVLGFAASGPLRRWIHATHLRAGILAVCALSALVLLIKSMLG